MPPCSSASTALGTQITSTWRDRPLSTVYAIDDFVADNNTGTVLVSPDATAAITVTFPPNPLAGQPFTLIANGFAIQGDGNGNDIDTSVATSLVAAGTARSYRFAPGATSADTGSWLPIVG